MNRKYHHILLLLVSLHMGWGQGQPRTPQLPAKEIAHVIYTLGDSGEGPVDQLEGVLKGLSGEVDKNPGTILFIGNSIQKKNREFPNSSDVHLQPQSLLDQWKLLEGTGAKVHFIPGNREWGQGLQGIMAQQASLQQYTHIDDIYLPKNGCPLEKVKISDQADLLILDSQWALMDWNKVPNLNADCGIKTREEFFEEVERQVVKSQGKSLLIAMHHPVASLGRHGNRRSFGVHPQKINNKYYLEFRDRLMAIARQWENVIFLSAHDNGLQFLEDKGIPVIISGSASKTSRLRKAGPEGFGTPSLGFAKIVVYEDGAIWVAFYSADNGYASPVFTHAVQKVPNEKQSVPEQDVPEYVHVAIYKKEDLERSGLYESIYGRHYKEDYTTPIRMKAVLLDTLNGGLRVVRKGGGHQTNNLRLEDAQGKKYIMRSLEKSAIRFLQYFVYKTQYLNPDYEETYLLQILQDYWTTANPYGLLTVGELSDAISVLHANPKLYYVPVQEALGVYNQDFGNKPYFIEEHLSDGHSDVESLGYSDEIVSTFELLETLRNRDRVVIDKSLYIRTRLFDNLIGDWDRHADQWRWTKEKQPNGKIYYRPIPRDRDQVYSDHDGFILRFLAFLSPPLRFMQRYSPEYKHVRWFNDAGDDVDLAVLESHDLEDWLREARYIKEHLTKEVIDEAFQNFPEEVDQKRKEVIKKALLGRLSRIEENAKNMYEFLSKYVVVTGTEGEDIINIERHDDGSTTITGHRIQGEGQRPFWDRTYSAGVTREIWVYGLDGADNFKVRGPGNGKIKIKVIGGNGNDVYEVANQKGIRIYDHRTQPNTFLTGMPKKLTDHYDLNTYHYMRHPRTLNYTLPILGYDPDNGVILGAKFNSEIKSLYRSPFSQKHSLEGTVFTGPTGIALNYEGEFAHVMDGVNLGINARYTSPNYIVNFFGFGSDTPNFDDDLDIEFNQARLQNLGFTPSLIFHGYQGSMVKLSASYDYYKVERSDDRFIASANVNPEVFEGQNFFGTALTYSYDNFDSRVQPKQGIGFSLTGGYTFNLDEDRSYGYLVPEFRVTSRVDEGGVLVLATKIKGHLNFNDTYEFYQAASIGALDGLRGFRYRRFSGKQAYYQTTDLRISLGRLNNGLLPTSIALYGGFDYGRVWQPGDTANQWHTSQGGGFYINLAGFIVANLYYFDSSDGGRFAFGLSMPF